MLPLAQADSTYSRIEKLVRRLTASPNQSSLPSSEIQTAVNVFYSQDFAYGIKIDQMRSVYTFYTQPNIDRYPLDVNFDQGVRAPAYVDNIQASFYKDRQQFFCVWPKFPTQFQPISGDGITQSFTFTIPGPFYSKEVILGGVDKLGNAITVADDGIGNMQYIQTNPVISNPLQTTNPAVPGMYNINTGNPGLINPTNIGRINYVTGLCSVNFALAPGGTVTPAAGQNMIMRVAQYTTGRPLSILFWNNEFTIRPCPKHIHQIKVETFLTPVQFMQQSDVPILNQWSQYIAYGTSMEILRQRQDMEGVQNLNEGFKRQEALVLERQGVEELFTPTPTVFNSPSTYSTGPWGNSGSSSW